jgi:hypothetical protein
MPWNDRAPQQEHEVRRRRSLGDQAPSRKTSQFSASTSSRTTTTRSLRSRARRSSPGHGKAWGTSSSDSEWRAFSHRRRSRCMHRSRCLTFRSSICSSTSSRSKWPIASRREGQLQTASSLPSIRALPHCLVARPFVGTSPPPESSSPRLGGRSSGVTGTQCCEVPGYLGHGGTLAGEDVWRRVGEPQARSCQVRSQTRHDEIVDCAIPRTGEDREDRSLDLRRHLHR